MHNMYCMKRVIDKRKLENWIISTIQYLYNILLWDVFITYYAAISFPYGA